MPKHVHRPLTLATPRPSGEDVEALQRAINQAYEHYRIDRRIVVDGEMGPQTLATARQVARMMGATAGPLRKLRRGRVPMGAQKLIRKERGRTLTEKAAHARRKPWRRTLRKKLQRTGAEKAIAWARTQVGAKDGRPANKWWGEPVQTWIKFTGYSSPVPWCGCFAAYATCKIGGAKIPTPIRLGYAGYIVEDARNGRNGLIAVPFDQARPGDILVFWGNQHIGLVDKRPEGDLIETVEGNTSSGSQADGGTVARKTRHRSDVTVVARWAS